LRLHEPASYEAHVAQSISKSVVACSG
jgi:hypothetical protein